MGTCIILDLGEFSAAFPCSKAGAVGSQNNRNRIKSKLVKRMLVQYVAIGLSVDMTQFARVFPFEYAFSELLLWCNAISVLSFFP